MTAVELAAGAEWKLLFLCEGKAVPELAFKPLSLKRGTTAAPSGHPHGVTLVTEWEGAGTIGIRSL